MLLSEFDYHLPEDLIAQEPLGDRSASRLLHLNRLTGEIADRYFRDIPTVLGEGDLLVINDTKVSALRLFGRRPTGAKVEALLIEEKEPGIYNALLRPGRRLRAGATILFDHDLVATVVDDVDGFQKVIRFDSITDLKTRLQKVGKVPLPPYISKPIEQSERYDTVYASKDGSAAAPTAGLHFTKDLLRSLEDMGVQVATVTLNVSIDTFRPVEAEDVDMHQIHGETCSLSEEVAGQIEACKGRIVAVGTTSVRTLESFAVGKRRVQPGSKLTKLYIRPGFDFNIVDGMFTNFHLPRTTMLMMISAFSTTDYIKKSYEHAVASRYRFLSFGDSMLIL